MASRTTSSPGRVTTPRHLLAPTIAAFVIAFIFLLGSEERVTRQTIAMAWLFIGLVGSSAYFVTRALQTRISRLEEELARLKR
jgi:hypothetical protein